MPVQPWQTVTVQAGATESEPIGIPTDILSCPPGKIRRGDGSMFRGKDRIKFDIEDADETGTTAKIVLRKPAPETIMFQVRAETDDD